MTDRCEVYYPQNSEEVGGFFIFAPPNDFFLLFTCFNFPVFFFSFRFTPATEIDRVDVQRRRAVVSCCIRCCGRVEARLVVWCAREPVAYGDLSVVADAAFDSQSCLCGDCARESGARGELS